MNGKSGRLGGRALRLALGTTLALACAAALAHDGHGGFHSGGFGGHMGGAPRAGAGVGGHAYGWSGGHGWGGHGWGGHGYGYGYGGWGWGLGLGYYDPFWYPYMAQDYALYPYYYDAPAAPVVAAGAALPPPHLYWYYCPDTRTYYPYVRECASPWQPVSPTPPAAPH